MSKRSRRIKKQRGLKQKVIVRYHEEVHDWVGKRMLDRHIWVHKKTHRIALRIADINTINPRIIAVAKFIEQRLHELRTTIDRIPPQKLELLKHEAFAAVDYPGLSLEQALSEKLVSIHNKFDV